MVTEPAETPLTLPVVAFTVASEVLLLLHVPPVVSVVVNVVSLLTHKVVEPLIVPGFANGLTVTILVTLLVSPPDITL